MNIQFTAATFELRVFPGGRYDQMNERIELGDLLCLFYIEKVDSIQVFENISL